MVNRRIRTAGLTGALMAVAAACVLAAPPRTADEREMVAKVRGADPGSQAFVTRARATSATVAALATAIQQTDVVVMVQVGLMPGSIAADTRLIAATPGCRYLIVRVHAARPLWEQVEYLGHELQHALEVAGAADVRDEPGLGRLMSQIGRATGRGTFETDAAVEVSRKIRRELLIRQKRPPRTPNDASARRSDSPASSSPGRGN